MNCLHHLSIRSGLTLAQNLRSKGLDFEIFERDEAQYTRNQGWAVALHWYA